MAAKILVIGGTGLVGNALVRALGRRGLLAGATTRGKPPSPLFSTLDITEPGAATRLIRSVSPSWVALPASNPFVDQCEQDPAGTRRVNVDGALSVLAACREAGSGLLYFSSDYVFDGRRGAYAEEDRPAPLNEYGRQKLEVEKAVLATGSSLVLRTSGVFGWETEPKNFVLQVRKRLAAGEPVKAATDIRYNPTYSDDLAAAAAALMSAGAEGLFHAVGAEAMTRHAFARQAAEAFGFDPARVEAARVADFKAPAARPADSSLVTAKLEAAVSFRFKTPREALADMARSESSWKAASLG